MYIVGGRILTMAGREIPEGILQIRNGKIAQVGARGEVKLQPEEGEQVVIAKNALIMPGIIEAHCHMGIMEEKKSTEGDDCNETVDPLTPALRAIDGINPMDAAFDDAVRAGITAAMIGPGSSNVVGGQFAMVKTKGRRIDDLILKSPAAMKVAFGENPKVNYSGQNKSPVTRMAIAAMLRREGITAAAYHGGMGHAERSLRQEEWVSGRTRVMVATNAFGMGIDKPDVRFVAHYSMCDSLESYYQEAGRAGRDGMRSYALLLVSSDDGERIVRRFEQEFPPLEKIKDIYERVCSYLQVGIGDGAQASFLFNIHDFCAREHLYSGTVVSALKLLQQNGYMTLTDAQENPARIMFCVSRDDLYKLRVQRDELDHFIRTLLRLYNGVFTEFRQIDEGEIATWSGYTVQRVKELLKRLWQLRVIRYVPSNRSPILFMDEERLPRADLYIAPETYRRRQELAEERFSHMIAYAANETECRSTVLERYFGAADPAPCGVCDICLAARKRAKSAEAPLDEEILRQLDAEPLAVKELAARFRCDAERVLEAVERLQHAGKISTAESGKLAINR